MKTEKEVRDRINQLSTEIGELRNELSNETCKFLPSQALISNLRHKIDIREIAVSQLVWVTS